MKAFVNVRGCNGSGKTTLLRSLVKRSAQHTVVTVEIPERFGVVPLKMLKIPITYGQCDGNNFAVLGDYSPTATGTTAGCDRIKTQEATKAALEFAAQNTALDFVLFEGVVVSTIFGPWAEWAARQEPYPMWWAFLDTPAPLCLERIQQRNGGQPIKEQLVLDKHETIERVRSKASGAGLPVFDLGHEAPLTGLRNLLRHIATGSPLSPVHTS